MHVQEMLSELRLKSLDELVQKTVPANIMREPLNFDKNAGTFFASRDSLIDVRGVRLAADAEVE
jgi:glycine cleavage system pyridoxal-binding protein P